MSPWVRLQENALDHPKIFGLIDYRRPFDLWVWGLSYAQKHLTDGFLPSFALPRGSEKSAPQLVTRRLWEPAEGGFQIHDYDEWNDTRETVLKKRAGSRGRAARSRDAHDQRAPHAAGGYVGSSSDSSEGVQGKPPQIAAAPDTALAKRGAWLLETYATLYSKHRNGARLRLTHSSIDWQKACDLCRTWDDERLIKLADIFLTTDEEWISGTDRSFGVFAAKATWCDDRLSAWEADRRKAAR